MHRSAGNPIRADRDGPSHFVRAYRCAAGYMVRRSSYVLGRPAPAKQDGSKHQNSHKRIHFTFIQMSPIAIRSMI
jgi:hypothetical protein